MKKGKWYADSAKLVEINKEYEINLDELLSNPTEMSPATYQYYKNLKNRTIIINEQITADIVESVMIPLLEMDNDGTGKPITILLSTVGGSLFDGITLCDIIDNLKSPTTIKVMTYAYSMGGIILMSGYNNPNDKKVCYKHSTALLHSGSTYLEGNSSSVKDQFHFNQEFEEKIKNFTLTHSKISEEEYNKMERYEWYMSSETMLDKGLVQEIL